MAWRCSKCGIYNEDASAFCDCGFKRGAARPSVLSQIRERWRGIAKGSRAASDPANRPPSSFYVWAPVDLLGLCQSFFKENGYSLWRPSLGDTQWKRVDMYFQQVRAASDVNVVVVLSEQSSEEAIESLYIYLEPVADAVIALGYTEQKVSITAPTTLWWIHEPAIMTLIGWAERLLTQGEVVEALLFSIERFYQIVQDQRRTHQGQ